MPWTIDLKSLDGSSTLNTATPFRSGRVTFALNDAGGADFELRKSDVTDGRWSAGERRVVVKDSGGTVRWAGWLDRLERGGPPGAITYRAASRGLAAALEEGIVHGNFQRVATVDTTIARDLIAHGVAQSNNKWGFTTGTHTGSTGPARDRYFCDGDSIGERVRELAEMSGGFSWEISPTGAFNTWRGARGTDLSGSITLTDAKCTDFLITKDTAELRTAATGMGDSDFNQPCGPPLVLDTDATISTYGRREMVVDTDSLIETEVEEKTTEELRASVASIWNLRASWVEGRGPWAFGTVGLGDIVDAALGTEFGGNRDMRLISMTVTFESKYEFIETEWEAV